MPTTISEVPDVDEKATSLGANTPESFAFLPRNFFEASTFDELLNESSVSTVRSLFRQGGIPETKIEKAGQNIPQIQENNFELVLPTLFVGSMILSNDPNLLSIALNMISTYAVDFLKGMPGDPQVKLEIIVPNNPAKGAKKITYLGPAEGLDSIAKIARDVFANNNNR